MTLLLVCFTAAMFLPIVLAFGSLRFRIAQFGKPDARMPREQAQKLEGAGHRVVAAQKNAWEALMMYCAAIVMAIVAGVPAAALVTPSLLFVGARFAHGIFYVADMAPLRTLAFLVGIGSLVWIIVKAFNV